MKSKRLIVISLDALGSTDFEMFSQLPNFKKFIDHAAFCRQVRSVYPSLDLSGPYDDRDRQAAGRTRNCEQYSDSAGTLIAGLVLAAEVYSGDDIV